MVVSLQLPEGLPLDTLNWEQTPLIVRQLVIHLLVVIRRQEEWIRTVEARMGALRAWRQRNLSNSDRPPSSDPSRVRQKIPSKPKGTPGAKPGHPWHRQALLEPTEVIEVQPPACGCAETGFSDAHPYHTPQVIELPEIQMTVRYL